MNGLSAPATIFAACPDAKGARRKSKSRREEETASPLAQRLGVKTTLTFAKGQEVDLAKAARKAKGPLLIVWEHDEIITLTHCLSSSPNIPKKWPSDRFDMVFVLSPNRENYDFSQVPQLLLKGDTAVPIV